MSCQRFLTIMFPTFYQSSGLTTHPIQTDIILLIHTPLTHSLLSHLLGTDLTTDNINHNTSNAHNSSSSGGVMPMYNLPLRSTNSPHGGCGSGSGGNSTVGTPTSSVSDFAKLKNLKNSSNNSSGKGSNSGGSSSSSSGSSSGDGHGGVMPMYNLPLRPTSTGGHSSNGGTPRSPGNDLVRSGTNHDNNNNNNKNNGSNGNSGSGGGGGGGSSSNSNSSDCGGGIGGVMPMYTLPLRSTGTNGSPRLWSTSSQIEEPPVKSPSQMYALPVKSSSQINAKETRDNVVPVGAMYVLPSKHSHSASQMAQSNLLAPSQIAQSNQSYEDRFSRVRAWVNDFLSYHTTSTSVHDKTSSAADDQSSSSSSSTSSSTDLYEWLRTGEVLCELMMKLRGPDGKYTNLGNTSGK